MRSCEDCCHSIVCRLRGYARDMAFGVGYQLKGSKDYHTTFTPHLMEFIGGHCQWWLVLTDELPTVACAPAQAKDEKDE